MNELDYINTTYDIDNDHSPMVEWELENPNVGMLAIVGQSGTGKTTLLRHWGYEDNFGSIMENNNTFIFKILNDKIQDNEKTSKLLFNVGLASIPTWKNTFSQLSNGEKMRFEIAYKLIFTPREEPIVIDEFTSMLDRQTSENLCRSLDKLLQEHGKKMIVSTCHFDILEWSKYDLVVDTTTKKYLSPQVNEKGNNIPWKYERYKEICGEYLTNIII